MTELEQILGREIKSLKELRGCIKEMQDSISNLNPEEEQFIETSKQLAAAQAQLTAVTKAGTQENLASTDSIIGMEREYKKLYTTYKALSEEQRNSDFGKEMAANLKQLSEELNETKKGVGNFKDNIGHYAEGVQEAFKNMGISIGALQQPFNTLFAIIKEGQMQSAGQLGTIGENIKALGTNLASIGSPAKAAQMAIHGVGAALKALIANPVGAAIVAIVAAFKALGAIVSKVKEAINKNEESQMKLKEAMASFQPVLDAVANFWDKIGTAVVKVIGWFADAFAKLREIRGAVTDFLGLTKGANQRIKEQNALYKDLAKSQNELIKTKREAQKLNAKDTAEVERLREEASETTNLTEKKKLLQEAKDKQAEIDNRNIEIAKEELRIIQEQSKLTANDAAANDKLAAAVAKVSEAEATAARNARQFNKQLSGAGGNISSVKNYREEAKKLYEETIEYSKTEIQKITEKYEKEKKLLKKYGYDTTLLTRKYNDDLAVIRKQEADKLKAEYMARQKWIQQEIVTNAYALGTSEAEVTKSLLDTDMGVFNASYEALTLTLKYTDTVEEKFTELKSFFDELNANGIEIEFPPEDLPLKTEEDLNRVLRFVESFGKELKKKIDKQKKDIEDSLVDERLTKKAQEKLGEIINIELQAMQNGMNDKDLRALIAKNTREQLEAQAAALKTELDNFKGTQEKKLELLSQYYEAVAQLREKDLAAEQLSHERGYALFTNMVELYSTVYSSIASISSAYENLINTELQLGKITDAEAKKRKKTLLALEKVTVAVACASIAASTAAGIMDVWKSYAAELALNAETAAAAGPGAAGVKAALDAKSLTAAIIKTTALGAAGAANMAATIAGSISKQQSLQGEIDGGSGVGVVADPQDLNTNPYSYTRQVQTAEEEDAIYNKEYWVSVTDINNVQTKVQVTDRESSF